MVAGVINKVRFFSGCDLLEVILVIDIHEEIPPNVQEQLDSLVSEGMVTRIVAKRFDHSHPRWNDHLYIESLRHATGDYVAHFDGDAVAFRRPEFPLIDYYIKQLDGGYSFVCQQTPLAEHGMWWASTRFFICKRSTLNLDEAGRAIDDGYRSSRYEYLHCPCFEHVISLITGRKVLYPPADYSNYFIVNWVHYYPGLLKKLNAMSFEDAAKYIFETCGGPHGAADLIGQPLC